MKDFVAERWATCKECPELAPGPFRLAELCRQCGCIMRAKVQIKSASCPLNKWSEIQAAVSPTDRGST